MREAYRAPVELHPTTTERKVARAALHYCGRI